MAAIDQYLAQILAATYGEEVRTAIHDAIRQNYLDVSDSVRQANEAADAAEAALINANAAITEVTGIIDDANTASQTANTASQRATTAASTAESAATRVEALENAYKNASATATALEPGATPTATMRTLGNGTKQFQFGIPGGNPGAKGDKGDKGDTGDTGAKGDKGDTGTTPAFSIGVVSTGAEGTPAAATISGTPEAPVLNLVLPKGDTGSKGDKGDKGDTGNDGAKGDKGDTGSKGDTGATPHLTIGTVTTGQEGSSAFATITGTDENPVLNLTIPRGNTGTAENIYGTSIPMSDSDSTKVKDAIDAKAPQSTTYTKTEVDTALSAKANQSTTYTKTEVDTLVSAATDPNAAHSVNGVTPDSTTKDIALDAGDIPLSSSDSTTIDTALAAKADQSTTYTKTEVDTALAAKANTSSLSVYVKTVNGVAPDPITGNVVVQGGGGSGEVGLAKVVLGIPVSSWQGNGPYTVTLSDSSLSFINSGMDVLEEWFEDASVMLGETTYTCGSGSLTISTTVLPTSAWSVTLMIGTNFANALDADKSIGIISRTIGIAVADWTGNGPYTFTYPTSGTDSDIRAGMKVIEEWLDDDAKRTGITSYTVGNGTLTVSTTEIPTQAWTLNVVLGMDGSDIVDDISAIQSKVGLAALETTAQNLSGAVNELNSAIGTVPSGSTVEGQISELNSNINTLDSIVYYLHYSSFFTSVTSLAVMKTELQNIADSMNVDEIRPVRFYCNFSDNGFVTNLRYFGNLSVFQKSGSIATVYTILFAGEQGHAVLVNNREGTWTITELATVS